MEDQKAQQPNAYAAVLADLERERDELDALIAKLRKKAFQGGEPVGPSGGTGGLIVNGSAGAPEPLPIDITPSTFFGMTIPDAIRLYLKMTKREARATAITKALMDGGLKTTSANFPASVQTALTRMRGEVVLLPTGWGLAEWYPGRKFEKRTRARSANEKKKSPA